MTFFKTPCYKGPHYDTPHFGGIGVLSGTGGTWPIPKGRAQFDDRDTETRRKKWRERAEKVAELDAVILSVLADELTDE